MQSQLKNLRRNKWLKLIISISHPVIKKSSIPDFSNTNKANFKSYQRNFGI